MRLKPVALNYSHEALAGGRGKARPYLIGTRNQFRCHSKTVSPGGTGSPAMRSIAQPQALLTMSRESRRAV